MQDAGSARAGATLMGMAIAVDALGREERRALYDRSMAAASSPFGVEGGVGLALHAVFVHDVAPDAVERRPLSDGAEEVASGALVLASCPKGDRHGRQARGPLYGEVIS